jgi:hypothetical protein
VASDFGLVCLGLKEGEGLVHQGDTSLPSSLVRASYVGDEGHKNF